MDKKFCYPRKRPKAWLNSWKIKLGKSMKAFAVLLFSAGAFVVFALLLKKFISGFGSIEMLDGIALLLMSLAAERILRKPAS